jgi:hypothetical protein
MPCCSALASSMPRIGCGSSKPTAGSEQGDWPKPSDRAHWTTTSSFARSACAGRRRRNGNRWGRRAHGGAGLHGGHQLLHRGPHAGTAAGVPHSRPVPEPWTPEDTLAWGIMMAWDLGGNWANELLRMRLALTMPVVRINELIPPYPGEKPRPVRATTPHSIANSSSTPTSASAPCLMRRSPASKASAPTTGCWPGRIRHRASHCWPTIRTSS